MISITVFLIFIITLSVMLIMLSYVVYNLLKKNESQEGIIQYQQRYMEDVDGVIRSASKKLAEIDTKGSFKSDDEIGWFFKYVLYIQELVSQFKLLNNEDIENQTNPNQTNPGRENTINPGFDNPGPRTY